jgi:hypothetical protein
MGFEEDTLEALTKRAETSSELAARLREDETHLKARGWTRLKNGSFIRTASLNDPKTTIKNTFYFAAYRQFREGPELRKRILEYLEPSEGVE